MRRTVHASTFDHICCQIGNGAATSTQLRQAEGMDSLFDCVVVGAGAAGLSAALVLGRARQRTLVIDAGQQSNLPSHGIGGLLGHDGCPPAEFYAKGREELAVYPSVEIRNGEVISGTKLESGFVLRLADGTDVTAVRVLLATGMNYELPDLPGLADRWGGAVFHCPFCHGWEVRNKPLAVLGQGDVAVHQSLLLKVWSDDVTLLTNGDPNLTDHEIATLKRAGIGIDQRIISSLNGPGDTLRSVTFANGDERLCEGMLVRVRLRQRSALASQLGAAALGPGPLMADAIEIDPMHNTIRPGLSAAGDVSAQFPTVAGAIASGSLAAAMMVVSRAMSG